MAAVGDVVRVPGRGAGRVDRVRADRVRVTLAGGVRRWVMLPVVLEDHECAVADLVDDVLPVRAGRYVQGRLC
jgi:hypothetical protein